MSPPLGGSLQLLSCSFFSCFSSRARRGSLPSSPDPEGGDSSTYRLPRIREFLLVPRRFSIWREFLRNQISIKITSGWPILRFVSTISLVRPLQSFSVDLEGKLTRVQKALVFFFFFLRNFRSFRKLKQFSDTLIVLLFIQFWILNRSFINQISRKELEYFYSTIVNTWTVNFN